MPSLLTWVDYDMETRKDTMEFLSQLQSREIRDEIGLGGIRNSFADQLFPGTSTAHKGLRYMLFVPWMYRLLEREKVSSRKIASRAIDFENELAVNLRKNKYERGIIGKRTRDKLSQLPSSIYWYGLGIWGIRGSRLKEMSQASYYSLMDNYYKNRKVDESLKEQVNRTGIDIEIPEDEENWNPDLPDIPEEFPEKVSMALTEDDAKFISKCIKGNCGDTLLSHLVSNCKYCKCDFPWEHIERKEFPKDFDPLLKNARIFSEIMYGASLLYNMLLVKKKIEKGWKLRKIDNDRKLTFKSEIKHWLKDQPIKKTSDWDLDGFWKIAEKSKHKIDGETQTFVKDWVKKVIDNPNKIINIDPEIGEFIEKRERDLKGYYSRFDNEKALKQWKGRSGMRRMDYRWQIVNRFISEIHNGLKRIGN